MKVPVNPTFNHNLPPLFQAGVPQTAFVHKARSTLLSPLCPPPQHHVLIGQGWAPSW